MYLAEKVCYEIKAKTSDYSESVNVSKINLSLLLFFLNIIKYFYFFTSINIVPKMKANNKGP